jgi:glycosyltransferase involved in cell wall biosynthesis
MNTLVILTLNEVEGLRQLFSRIPQVDIDRVIAIDGGSKDGTVEFLKEKGIEIYLQTKKGRGEAFKLASKLVKEGHLVFFSPDGNEDPEDIPKLFRELNKGYDMVVASRFLPGARNEEDQKIFAPRKWANIFFTKLANLIWQGNLTDTINGFRAVRGESLNRMKIDATGFEVEYQMSIRALKLKMKIAEIPTIEGVRIGDKSKVCIVQDGLRFLNVLLIEIFKKVNFNETK